MAQSLSKDDISEIFSRQQANGLFSALAVETACLNRMERLNRRRLDLSLPPAERRAARQRLVDLEGKLVRYIREETPLSYFDADFRDEAERYVMMREIFLKAVSFTFKRHRLAFLLDLLRLYGDDPCGLFPEREFLRDKVGTHPPLRLPAPGYGPEKHGRHRPRSRVQRLSRMRLYPGNRRRMEAAHEIGAADQFPLRRPKPALQRGGPQHSPVHPVPRQRYEENPLDRRCQGHRTGHDNGASRSYQRRSDIHRNDLLSFPSIKFIFHQMNAIRGDKGIRLFRLSPRPFLCQKNSYNKIRLFPIPHGYYVLL